MTCKEKLKADHPEFTDEVIDYIINQECPSDFYLIMKDPDYCSPYTDKCKTCWDREIPETPTEGKTVNELRENCGRVIEQAISEIETEKHSDSIIKDSGDRTQFESGAVRDMHEGKGRFDVAPLEVISDMLGTKEVDHDPVLLDIATFMYEYDTGWLHAALDNFATMAYEGCIYTMLLEVARHYEDGAKKYGPDNWRRGIPAWCYIDSAVRHYLKWRRGDNDEHHNRAFIWNLMCCIWEVDYGDTWRKDKET